MTLAQLRTLLPVPLGLAAFHAPEALLHRDGGLVLALLERRDAVRRRGVADAHAAHGHGLVVGILSLAGEHGHWCWVLRCFWFDCCATRLCRSVGLPKSCGIAVIPQHNHKTIFTFFGQIDFLGRSRARTKCTRLSTRRDDTIRYCKTLRTRAKMIELAGCKTLEQPGQCVVTQATTPIARGC